MRIKLFLLTALSVFLACCGTGPSANQIEAALNESVKAKNPDASAKITSTKVLNEDYVEFTFSCTNCVFQFKNGERDIPPSSEGSGMVTLSSSLKRWKFDRIVVASKGIGQVIYESDHIF